MVQADRLRDFGVRELWVIDAGRRIVHRHLGQSAQDYAMVDACLASKRLLPTFAPEGFACALDDLDEI